MKRHIATGCLLPKGINALDRDASLECPSTEWDIINLELLPP